MIASGSRAEALRRLSIPTLVIHGLDDTLIVPSGGERTAALVPGARLLLIEDMGHDRPEPLWPEICGRFLSTPAEPACLWRAVQPSLYQTYGASHGLTPLDGRHDHQMSDARSACISF